MNRYVKKEFLLTLVATALMGHLAAAPVAPQKAREAAMAFAMQMKNSQQVTLCEVELTARPSLHLFNLEGGGYVIASGDDRARPILGYSTTGSLQADGINPNLAYWLSEYQRQIEALGDISLEKLYAAYTPSAKPSYPDSVAPLLQTQWSQYRHGYNSRVPYDSTYAADSAMLRFQNHPTVGCGAVAMGQVMRYWQFPAHGYGTHSYSHDYDCWRYGTLSADYANTTYDYSLMPSRLTDSSSAEEAEAVATLLSHCGIAANMQYNSDCNGSSASTIGNNLTGLQRFFHYSPNATVDYLWNHGQYQWADLLKADLSQGRPIYYCGQSNRDDAAGTLAGGHAFVCDGYDANDYFHFNWGWGGTGDGFYALSVLRPLTEYDFSPMQYCIFGLEPCRTAVPIMVLGADLQLNRIVVPQGGRVSGRYAIANIGDSVLNTFVGVNIYGQENLQYYGCVDGRHVVVAPGDTLWCDFSYALELPQGEYQALMQYSHDTFYAGIEDDVTLYMDDLDHHNSAVFSVTDSPETHLSNLVVFVRFADDGAFQNSFSSVDNMFNGTGESVKTYFHEMSYHLIEFNTVYASTTSASTIEAYVHPQPRSHYQPQSRTNPDGYEGSMPQIGISMLEARLIEDICRYVDSTNMVPDYLTLDGNGDGDIDNVSFIVQGHPDNWGDFLWPHMEYFPHDSIGYTLTINGKRVNCFNFEFEGSPFYFTTHTFCHEMGHSIGLPDLYHYNYRQDVDPVPFDIMCSSTNQPSAVYKWKVLELTPDPQPITTDGTYTINSVGSSPENNLFYIPSAIDPRQWFTIEYRSTADFYESDLPHSGLVMGRWMDTVPNDQYYIGNAFYDGITRPNTYWVFRPGSRSDSQNGVPRRAVFYSTGQNFFGPNTDPYPYLADGTPENSFEIYDISESGSTCTFKVRFLGGDGIADSPAESRLRVSPNPTVDAFAVEGLPTGAPIKVYDARGVLVLATAYNGASVHLAELPDGLYFVATPQGAAKLLKSHQQ